IAVSPIRDRHGRLIGVSKIARDITERKRAEDALRSSERRYSLLFETMAQGVVYQDAEGGIVDMNPAAEAILKTTSVELKGQTSVDREHFTIRADGSPFRGMEHPAMVALKTGQIVRNVLMGVRDPKGGEYRWIDITAVPLFRDGENRPHNVCALFDDITERKQAEDAQRRYATRLGSLHDIDRAILAIQPPEKIAGVALRHLAKLVPCWRASVARIVQGALESRVLTSIGALSRRTAHGAKGTLTVLEPEDLETLKCGQSKIVDDLHNLTSMSKPLKLMKDAGARSVARLPLLVRGRLIGSINFYSDRPGAYTAENVEVIREAANQVAIALHNSELYEENRVARERLEVLSRRLIRAQEDERRRIARELHDEIGQALTAVTVNLQSVDKRVAVQDDRVAECIAIVDDTLGRVRGMALDLRPSLLDDLGLVAALQWYVERHARRTGMAGRFIADPEKLRAAPEIETACFRVVQEALTNTARHARATRFSVELLQHNGGLELIVRDDGCGFDPSESLERAAGGASLGLVGMIERIELIGGKIAFISAPGKGTEVQASIPRITPGSAAVHQSGSSS
ncbi:MAG TPA: PAS domain S-box protein, partial [Isosphaeraceae bacterium]|nr:PAS domain S-box protein [Isosphaeraceae bacterium]